MESVTGDHLQQTAQRCKGHNLIYAVQDTDYLDCITLQSIEGLGLPCYKEMGFSSVIHSSFAVTPNKMPLGLLYTNISDLQKEYGDEKIPAKNRKFVEKDNNEWFMATKMAEKLIDNNCKIVHVGDRESDVFEIFAAERPANSEFIIRWNFGHKAKRKKNDAKNADESDNVRLFTLMEKTEPLGEYTLKIPARKGRKAAEAVIIIRSGCATFHPQKHMEKQGSSQPITLNWVWAVEKNAQKNPIDWKLLTTLPVESLSDAIERVEGYSTRLTIEEYHGVLKTGCKIEGLQYQTLDIVLPALDFCRILAWRVFYIYRYARENFKTDITLVSTELEREILNAWLKRERINLKVKTVQDFVRGVGILGGLPARPSAGNPGIKNLWQGLNKLEDLIEGVMLLQTSFADFQALYASE
ncbi:MAG: IS4 family transposase [Firmicutes bacterium]|nr:IS4 family transposase [Bacillota bacterium]